MLRGRLLAGTRDRYLQRDPGRNAGSASNEPLWWTPTKVAGRYLSPYLIAKDVVHVQSRGGSSLPQGLDVDVPLTWQQKRASEILGLDPLGPMTAVR